MKCVAVFFGNPEKLPPYEAAIRAAGLEPILNPSSFEQAEGLLLTGGTDLNPLLYGESRGPNTDQPDDDRDESELQAVHEALRLNVPILGICRGMQTLNVALGGSLKQHIANGTHEKRDVADAHKIRLEPASKLGNIIGVHDYAVNSRHHQCVARIGASLHVCARSNDDVVEGIEDSSRPFVIGVQWHPEDRALTHDGDRRLFAAFAKAIAENRR